MKKFNFKSKKFVFSVMTVLVMAFSLPAPYASFGTEVVCNIVKCDSEETES